jgi:hypothetical protein
LEQLFLALGWQSFLLQKCLQIAYLYFAQLAFVVRVDDSLLQVIKWRTVCTLIFFVILVGIDLAIFVEFLFSWPLFALV